MLVGGVAMTTIGLRISGHQANSDQLGYVFTDKGYGSANVSVAGIGIALGSIPFFISSAKNARRASTLSVNAPKILLRQQNTSVCKIQPAITLRIGL